MEKKFAKEVVEQLKKLNGPQLSLLEAMSMNKLTTDGIDVYAIQKGDVTFLAWIKGESGVRVKTIPW